MLSRMLQYANGQPMQEGDAVRLDPQGNTGTVIELVTDRQQIESRQLSGPGVVIETANEGVVFLSTELLRTEPIAFMGHGASESTVFNARATVAAAAVLIPVAIWSFFSAIYFAWTTGQVMVMAYDSIYESVPWRLGWARFVGPVVLTGGVLIALMEKRRSALWWTGAILAGAGVVLLAFSAMFTSPHRAGWAVAFAAGFPLVVWVDRKFGRLAAFVFMLAGVLALVVFAARKV